MKESFLATLRNALQGEMSPKKIEEILTYYTKYIDENENNRLEELGDPRLIAKSIIDAESSTRNRNKAWTNHTSGNMYDEMSNHKNKDNQKTIKIDGNKWYAKIIGVMIGLMILVVIFSLVKILFVTSIFIIKILFVLAIPLLFVSIIYNLIKKR